MSERRNAIGSGVVPDLAFGLSVVAAVVVLDQLSKAASAAQAGADLRNSGLLLGVGAGPRLALIALSCGVIAVFVAATRRTIVQIGGSVVGPMLVVGGMIGNLADRVRFGSVRDFLTVGPFIVNVADLAVAVGIALTIAGVVVRVLQLRISGDALAFDRQRLRLVVVAG
jgi:lipoprotein signal peptidase